MFMAFCISIHATSNANEYIDRQEKAKALMRRCDESGKQATADCIEGLRQWNAASDRLMSDINNSIEQKDQERQRVQQDEMWREQIRRQRWHIYWKSQHFLSSNACSVD